MDRFKRGSMYIQGISTMALHELCAAGHYGDGQTKVNQSRTGHVGAKIYA